MRADYEALLEMGDPELVRGSQRWAPLSRLQAIWPQVHAIRIRGTVFHPARDSWIALMRILDILGERYGTENVRVIHWSHVVM